MDKLEFIETTAGKVILAQIGGVLIYRERGESMDDFKQRARQVERKLSRPEAPSIVNGM